MSFRKILVAVDEDAFSARAADVGFELARSLGQHAAAPFHPAQLSDRPNSLALGFAQIAEFLNSPQIVLLWLAFCPH